MLFYSLLVRETAIGSFYSLMATLLGVSYPAYEVHLALTTFTYIAALPFFLAGTMALFAVDDGCNSTSRFGFRLLSHSFLLLSYISEAYVVAGVALPFLIVIRHRNHAYTFRLRVAGYCKYLDIAFVAVAYMAAMYFLMPVHGTYSHSRDISFSAISLIESYSAYFSSALDFNILNLTAYKLHRDVNLVLWLLLFAIGSTVFRHRFQDRRARMFIGYAATASLMMGAIATPFVIASAQRRRICLVCVI